MGSSVISEHFNMYKFALLLTLAFLGASGKNLVRNDGDDHDFTDQDLENLINLVFCVCDSNGDFQLTLDEYLGPICEAVGVYMFDHENDENDLTIANANEDEFLTVEEVFNASMSEIPTGRISAALRGAALRDFQKDDAIEAGVRVLGCACDTDGSLTVSFDKADHYTDFSMSVNFDEANDEQCIGVQEWMAIGHDGEDFLGPYFDQIDQDGNGEIDHQEATDGFNYAIDLENTIHMVFCACDTDYTDYALTLDEYLTPVCEAVGFFMFHHENSEDEFTIADTNGDGILTPGDVFSAVMNGGELHTRRSFAALRQSFDPEQGRETVFPHLEAGVRVLGCACDTDGSMTVSFDEANAEECLHVQHMMTEHEGE